MKKIILSLIFLTSVSHAWFFNNSNTGLTGYSVPVSQDVFKQLGIDPYNTKQNLKSPNVRTDLFSSPQTNYNYNKLNGIKKGDTESMDAKCGVTIIYD